MSQPLVSVLVRSVDRPTLSRALASIAQQDYPNVEAVVVAASAAHRELPDRCGPFPLRLVRASRPLARADAANAALGAARGEWLNLLDDDDELLPSHVARLRAALDAEPGFLLAHSVSEDRDSCGRVLGRYGGRFKPWRQLDTGFFRPHCAMFARALVDGGARFDPAFGILEDMDFFIQCAQRTPFLFVAEATTRYYADAGNSGAGAGSNRDEARIADAVARLRAKWSGLETALRATPEFRAEQALFLIENGYPDDAVPLVAGLLRDDPRSVDARILNVLQLVARGDVERARPVLDAIGDAAPRVEDLARRLDQVRSRIAIPR
jgi:hypothetical protein